MNALIIVDVQNDFCPGGALPVPEGDRVVDVINRLQPRFDLVVATEDWHPPDHVSFFANHPGHKLFDRIQVAGLEQTLWPAHCVQDTPGAELHPRLDRTRIARIIRKGTDPAVDSYSGFFDNGRRHATGLGDYLRAQGVTDVYVCGLATDYCVRATALDAVKLGFRTHVIEDACRGVEQSPGAAAAAIDAMRHEGVQVVQSAEITDRRRPQTS